MTDFIVDASVAVKWFVAEPDAQAADELSLGSDRLFAPQIIFGEIANALCRKTSAGLMSAMEAVSYFRSLRSYFDGIVATDDLLEAALLNGCTFRHPVYDFIYLEAARRMNAVMITADRRFAAKLAGTEHARYVTLLSDWQPV
ncbi:type II toxin-antitoxin system VapC family toxin [Rhodopseudomonas palustris]|uniref:type II toxin-antitoxin system VapC family toxin n=1 Tax=Rhodopseudomonas palustris TaxID=1076 RepID=UPI002ACEC3C1|nr:type II toxin-antitoxin system VapC family toxin [Rhodopseudomonas palustris]WQH01420.1 type II toxin-antitoxin system VapC family toxin [Rhodopseudomonas palustris]